jgi:hypothetical protein
LPRLGKALEGRRQRVTGAIWQLDVLHGDHWEVVVGRPPQGKILMAASVGARKTKTRAGDLARRLASLTTGLTVARVLKADDRELVVEFEDGTRLLVRADERLDISVTGGAD